MSDDHIRDQLMVHTNPLDPVREEPASDHNVHVLTTDEMERWKRLRVIRGDADTVDYPLEPVAGAKVIGEVTEIERSLFIEQESLFSELNDVHKLLTARTIGQTHQLVIDSDTPADFKAALPNMKLFTDDDEAEEFYRETARYEYLHNSFWFMLRNRLNNFTHKIAIRAGWKVVALGLKYKQ